MSSLSAWHTQNVTWFMAAIGNGRVWTCTHLDAEPTHHKVVCDSCLSALRHSTICLGWHELHTGYEGSISPFFYFEFLKRVLLFKQYIMVHVFIRVHFQHRMLQRSLYEPTGLALRERPSVPRHLKRGRTAAHAIEVFRIGRLSARTISSSS